MTKVHALFCSVRYEDYDLSVRCQSLFSHVHSGSFRGLWLCPVCVGLGFGVLVGWCVCGSVVTGGCGGGGGVFSCQVVFFRFLHVWCARAKHVFASTLKSTQNPRLCLGAELDTVTAKAQRVPPARFANNPGLAALSRQTVYKQFLGKY